MDTLQMNPKAVILCAWTGPAIAVVFFIGFSPLAHFLPPPDPAASSAEIARMYQENTNGIRAGVILMLVSQTFLPAWGVSICAWTRRMERGVPILTLLQVSCMATGTALVLLYNCLWGVAAFRPDIQPDIIRVLNDIGWFLFLFIWPVFALWPIAISLCILWDHNEVPLFPRWVAYFGFWVAFLNIPASAIIFFKDGPLAFNGLFAMYIPLFIFFIYILVMTYLVIQKTKQHGREHSHPIARDDALRSPLVAESN